MLLAVASRRARRWIRQSESVHGATQANSSWWSAFAVSSNDPPYFSFHCSGSFEVSGDPAGPASAGQAVDAWVSAPTGITIAGASATGSVYNLNDGSGWVGGSMFYGGGTAWVNGATSMMDSGLASPYWGRHGGMRRYLHRCRADLPHFDLPDRQRNHGPKSHPDGIDQPLGADASRGMDLEPSRRPVASDRSSRRILPACAACRRIWGAT